MRLNEYQARAINTIVEATNQDYFVVIDALKKFRRYASTLHRLDENSCNGWPKPKTEIRDGKIYRFDETDEAWQKRDEEKEERTQKKAEELAKKMGWSFERQGDPRGFPFYVLVTTKDGRTVSIADIIA